MRKILSLAFFSGLISLIPASAAMSQIIADFTAPGTNGDSRTVETISVAGTGADAGITFDIDVTAVIPAGGGANGGDVALLNGGFGSTVENGGGFVNVINGVPEVLRFTISNVQGLAAGQTLQLANLLSQNGNSQNPNQGPESGAGGGNGFGGTFGHQDADSVTLTSDSGASVQIDQSDSGDLGAILLANDNGEAADTGNTFAHSAGGLDFTDFIDLQLTDLMANEAIVIQGMEFSVFPSDSMGMLGDVDRNGVVDFFDIAPFIDLLSNQTFQFEADIDGNMVVDFFDIAPFIAILSGQ